MNETPQQPSHDPLTDLSPEDRQWWKRVEGLSQAYTRESAGGAR